MGVVFIIVSVVALLSVPIMLIVSLVKLSKLEECLSSFGRKIEMFDSFLKGRDKEDEIEASDSPESAAMPVEPETATASVTIAQPEPPPIAKISNQPSATIPDEPTAIGLFLDAH